MVRIVLANAFSVNMLDLKPNDSRTIVLQFRRTTIDFVRKYVPYMARHGVEIYSVIGHESTAKLLSSILGIDVPVNRAEYKYSYNDIVIVFTVPYRLPEGKVLSEEELQEIMNKISVYLVLPPPILVYQTI